MDALLKVIQILLVSRHLRCHVLSVNIEFLGRFLPRFVLQGSLVLLIDILIIIDKVPQCLTPLARLGFDGRFITDVMLFEPLASKAFTRFVKVCFRAKRFERLLLRDTRLFHRLVKHRCEVSIVKPFLLNVINVFFVDSRSCDINSIVIKVSHVCSFLLIYLSLCFNLLH
jgi:hypothetical protein